MEEADLPWILKFISLPQSLVDEDPESSLEILCYTLIHNPDIAQRVWQTLDALLTSTYETLYMVFFSSIFAVLIGLPLGMILTVTKKHSIMSAPLFNKILGSLINITRSFPFIVLIIVVWPISKFIVGTSIGQNAAIVSLTIAAIPFVARLFEGTLEEVNKGLIEATLSMGATKLQVMIMMVVESLPALVHTITILIISIIGYSAMAGILGAGGLGDFAYREGFNNNNIDALYSSVIMLIVIVQIIQSIGDYISRKLRHI